MEVTQNQAQTPPLFPGQDTTNTATSSPALSSDFETFLKMLTVQMENQDPLNPVDSADYAVQLATFSSVEQQVLTNDLLSALNTSMAGGGIGALGQWVGMQVRAGDTAYFSGEEISLAVPAPDDIDQRLLVIRDANGEIAARVNVPIAGKELIWDGTLADGSTAQQGNYQFAIEGLKNGVLQTNDPVTPYGRVREAVIENGKTMLILDGDIAVSPTDVTALRDRS